MLILRQNGMSLAGTLVSMAVLGIIVTGIMEVSRVSGKMQVEATSKLDQNILIEDIKNSLQNNVACMKRFGDVQKSLVAEAKHLQVKLSSGEVLAKDTELSSYNLKNVSVLINKMDTLQVNPTNAQKLILMDISLHAEKRDGSVFKDRPLGSLYVMTSGAGDIISCSFGSVEEVVQCAAGQYKVSQGEGQIPRCLASVECSQGQVQVSNGPGVPPTCRTIASLMGPLCPAGKFLSSNGSEIVCLDPPRAEVVETAKPPSGGDLECAGGRESVQSPDGKSTCSYGWSAAKAGQAGTLTFSEGPISQINGRCVQVDAKTAKWHWSVTCAVSAGVSCEGGRVTASSPSGRTVCTYRYSQGMAGATQRVNADDGNGFAVGTCMPNGKWNYTSTCNDSASTVSCPSGEESHGRCFFRWSGANVGETRSVNSTNVPGAMIRATCGPSGTWTNVSISGCN